MKIESKRGKGNKIHISLDGEYALTVDSDYWYTSRWFDKKEIDDEDVEELKEEIEKRRAFNNALDLISVRLHSRKELKDKLRRKYSETAAESAAEKAVGLGLVNDEYFAEIYASELCERKKYGLMRIRQELRQKGIDSDIIENVLSSLDFDSKESIIDIINKKYSRKLSDANDRKKVVAALQRLGYSFSDIRSAMNEFESEDDYGDFL